MSIWVGIEKLKCVFDVAPWLITSKNAVHMGVRDPMITNYNKSLPQLTWAELYEMMTELQSLAAPVANHTEDAIVKS